MYLYTYLDANDDVVCETSATTDLVTARDFAARRGLKLIENTFEFSDSAMIEDYTPEDESDG